MYSIIHNTVGKGDVLTHVCLFVSKITHKFIDEISRKRENTKDRNLFADTQLPEKAYLRPRRWPPKEVCCPQGSYIFYAGGSIAGVSCRRQWPPPTTLALTTLVAQCELSGR